MSEPSYCGLILNEKYEVKQVLGKGGMGTVHEGTHIQLGRRVAIKFMLPELASNPQVLERFHQEARIAGGLGHPNICEVTDVGQADDGAPYMVMPYLEGETLAARMRQAGKMPIGQALAIMEQILSALATAHAAGIIHRDLKPENIFLASVGEREDYVRILDFGISKVMADRPGPSELTSTGMVMGTAYYMAPEQARGAKHVDQRVDVYAAGVILYEMLTGSRPFEADSLNEMIIKIATEPFPRPRVLVQEIPEALEAVVLKAMSRAPEDRIPSASVFRRELLHLAGRLSGPLPAELAQQAISASPTPNLPGRQIDHDQGQDQDQDQDHGSRRGRMSGSTEMAAASLERTSPRRRWKMLVGALAALIIAATSGVLWIAPWRQEGSSTGPAATTGSTGSPAPDMDAETRVVDSVSIRFIGLPGGAKLEVDGKIVAGGSIDVRRGSRPLRYRAKVQDHGLVTGTFVPDQDRIVLIDLAPRLPDRPPAMRAANRTTHRRLVRRTGARHPRVAPRRIHSRVHRRASPAPRTRTRAVIHGRHGTEIDTRWDEE